jgi:manganese/zinc/iron transport system permease protein
MNALAIVNWFAPWHPEALEIAWPMILQGMMVSVALGLIGCFLVVRGMSLLGDALSHSVLPGIVIGFLIGGSLASPWILIGATFFGLLAAVLVQAVQDHSRVKEDASLGITFTTLFALGVVMVNQISGVDLDPGCVLYGNLEFFIKFSDTVHPGLWPMGAILIGIIVCLVVFYRQLLLCTFDPGLAVSLGIPAAFVHYAVMTVLSLTVVASFEAVGAILAVALLILPGAAARLWTDRMRPMLLIAAAHGIVSTILGYWFSHYEVYNTSAAGSICTAGFGLFILTWLFAPHHGLLTRAMHRRRFLRNVAAENLLKTIGELSAGQDAVPLARLRDELRMSDRHFKQALAHATGRQWVTPTDSALSLTTSGRDRYDRLQKAHIMWEQYLKEQVGLAEDHVHDAAEWIEHHLNEEQVREIDQALADKYGR